MQEITFVKFGQEDFHYYFQLVSNEKVMAQITEQAIPEEEAKIHFQEMVERNSESDLFGTYKVYKKGIFIGLGHLTPHPSNDRKAEIGYGLLPEYWGKGYGSAIANHLVHLAELTNITILKAIINPRNIASRNILIKQGFISVKVCEIDGLPGEILSKTL